MSEPVRFHRAVALLAAALLITACGVDEGSTTTVDEGSTTTLALVTTSAVLNATTTAPEPATTTTTAGEPGGSEVTAETEIIGAAARDEAGLDLIDLLTPLSGGGPRPELAWDPVDGASLYGVFVFDPSGRAYWAWEGRTTSIHVGGEPAIEEGRPGPSVIEGMSWQVAAWDAESRMIALSHRRMIAP